MPEIYTKVEQIFSEAGTKGDYSRGDQSERR